MSIRQLAALTVVSLGCVAATGTHLAGAATTAPAGGAPSVSALSVTARLVAPRGHARLLVGARISAPATLVVKLVRSGKVVRQLSTPKEHAPGRVYVLVEAVDARGFQLPEGAYTVNVQARSAGGALSRTLTARTTLDLSGALGQLDFIATPTWTPVARQLGVAAGSGIAVAIVAPKGAAATAGIRKGDVITAINGRPVATAGAWRSAIAALPAGTPIAVQLIRGGQPVSTQMTLSPDWTPAPSYGPALTAALKREPACLACRHAQVRIELDAGQPANATGLLGKWPPSLRRGFIGQMAAGDIAIARGDGKTALAAYQRAITAAPDTAAALYGQALAYSLLGQFQAAADVLAQAATLDPADAEILAARAFALLRLDQLPEAVALTGQALSVDPTSANARIAQGIALVASGSTSDGLAALREGIRQLDDPSRAAAVIAKNLEPNDP